MTQCRCGTKDTSVHMAYGSPPRIAKRLSLSYLLDDVFGCRKPMYSDVREKKTSEMKIQHTKKPIPLSFFFSVRSSGSYSRSRHHGSTWA